MGRKSKELKTWVSEDFADQIQDQAEKEGLSVSSYIRTQLKQAVPQQVQQA